MAIQIKDLWKLPSFREAKVLTGEEYLGNLLRQVSIADTPPTSVDYVVSQRGDFYISSMYYVKDREEDMYRFLETLIDTGASGLCIIDEYLTDLPAGVKAFSRRQHLPILMVDKNIPYADMIKEVMELLLSDQQKIQMETKVLALMGDTCNREQRSSILYDINPHFLSRVIALYLSISGEDKGHGPREEAYDFFNHAMDMAGVRYRDGVFGIVSYSEDDSEAGKKKVSYCLDEMAGLCEDFYLGISGDHPLSDCGLAMEEALFASRIALSDARAGSTVFFDHMGPLKLLSHLYGRPELDDFSRQGTQALLEYDESHSSGLYDTMVAFIGNGRDYRKTAEEMYLHQNTIRYRVRKAGELMNGACPSPDFCETFSLAHKIRMLRSTP